jgi:glyoxylase-like metal-dependent hydrolase (beta-lactamase superfamily II)
MRPFLHIETIVSAPFQENTYVVWLDGRADSIVFDPGFDPDSILDLLRQKQLTVAALLITHGHADHIGGNEALKSAFPAAPIVIGANETHMLTDAMANMSAQFGLPVISPPADRLVREGDVVEFAGMRLEVREIPGHSAGHVVYIYRSEPSVVFGGDVLFQGSIGRCDLPGGDADLLVVGIRE